MASRGGGTTAAAAPLEEPIRSGRGSAGLGWGGAGTLPRVGEGEVREDLPDDRGIVQGGKSIGDIKAILRPGQGRRGPVAGWRAARAPCGPQHRSPSQGRHQPRSCAGDRGGVTRRSSGAASDAETGTAY